MSYSDHLRSLFPGLSLQVEDLLLLETFQVKNLPARAPARELATLIRTHPMVHRFLLAKHPPIKSFLDKILDAHTPASDPQLIRDHCQEALWEVADLIIYNKHPEMFDQNAPIRWEPDEISSICTLEGKVAADVGAGTGRIAFQLVPLVQTMYAVEPVTALRTFMKEKAQREHTDNLFVMDGTLDAIPLPDDSLDILITSNAIAWNLEDELREIERVVKPGGCAIHLLFSDLQHETPYHEILTSPSWNYQHTQIQSENKLKIRYYKTIPR